MALPAHVYLRKRKKPEQGLQLAVAQFLNMALPKDAVWFAVPNGGMRDAAEMQILKRGGLKAGIPDLVIFYKKRGYCIELKSLEGVLSPAQKRVIDALKEARIPVSICRSVDEVQAQLDGWRIPVLARTFGFLQAKEGAC